MIMLKFCLCHTCPLAVRCARCASTWGLTLQVLVFAFRVQIPPYEKEIYVITMIKIKINEHCEQAAASAGGAAA